MALIKEITLPESHVKVNEIKISTFFDLEDNIAKVICKYIRSDTKKMISQANLVMPQDIYSQWGADNQYIINWVAEQLNLELINKYDNLRLDY